MSIKQSKFPKSILVKREEDGDTSYLVVGEPAELAETGEKVSVARYVLANTGVVHAYADYIEGAED